MAKNLRSRIDHSDSMIVYDVNVKAAEQLAAEVSPVDVAKDVREVAERSVSTIGEALRLRKMIHHFPKLYELSWQRKL